MSTADEDSFIVIEETPSMLQFSLLDSISSNRSNEQSAKLHESNASAVDTNSSLFSSALPQTTDSVDAMPKIDKNVENTSIQSNGSMLSNVSHVTSAHTNTQKSHDGNGHFTPTSNNTLAHSFLLGDINCDIMKVNEFFFPKRIHSI